MKHLDEHTIELYILGSDLVKEQTGEIETHLKECHGCRSLAEQMKVFYENTENELETSKRLGSEPSKAIVKRQAELDFTNETFTFPVQPSGKRYLARFLYFVYRHPVASIFGGVTSVALLAAGLVIGVNNISTDKNPSYPILDPVGGKMVIYNQNDEPLWSIPSKTIGGATPEELNPLYKLIKIFDIDEDGKNEVITALPLGDQILNTDTLKIISADKKNVKKIAFEENIQFNDKIYDKHWAVSEIHCGRFCFKSKPEILLLASNKRSPTILFRLDDKGNNMGEYVHYGYFRSLFFDTADVQKRVFLCGQNDLGEIDSLSSPVLVGLDLKKIFGKTESSGTPGFGLEKSKAELFYISFPLTDLNYLWKTQGLTDRVSTMRFGNNKVYSAQVYGTYNNINPVFEYLMSEDMKVLEVKYSSETLQLRQKLLQEGLIKGTFDEDYLSNMKKGVRYWDGKEWKKEVVRVKNEVTIVNE